jgi:hypothetical protein
MCGIKGADFALVPLPAISFSLALGILVGVPQALAAPSLARMTPPQFDILHRASSDLTFVVDDVTGVRVGIPAGIVAASRNATYGRNWKAPDNRLNIDTLVFRDRTLQALYATLRNKSGRRITNGDLTTTGFLLEGVDSDGTLFHVVARAQGSEIRGLSIVYSNRARNEIAGIAQSMLNTFEAFPGAVVATGQVDTRSAVLEQQLSDVKRREQELLRREEEERRKASAQSGANDRRIAELERQLSDNRQREEELRREEERRKAAGQNDTRIAELERQLAEIRRREIEIAKRDEEEKRKAKDGRERAAREDAIRKEEQEKASKERQKLLKELEARQEKPAGELKAVGLPAGKRVAHQQL